VNFQPISAEQAQSQKNTSDPVKPGVYDFEVTDAKVVQIKSKTDGSEQIEFVITIYGTDGERCGRVWDYLQFDGKTAWKLRHAMYSIGLGADYERGTADPQAFIGLTGKADIGLRKAEGVYKEKNIVRDYVPKETQGQQSVDWRPPKDDMPF
jgi:hypothetical protein